MKQFRVMAKESWDEDFKEIKGWTNCENYSLEDAEIDQEVYYQNYYSDNYLEYREV